MTNDQKTKIIDDLIANTGCQHQGPWTDEDREALQSFPDTKLEYLNAQREHMARNEVALNAAQKGYEDKKTGKAYRLNLSSGNWEEATLNAPGKPPIPGSKPPVPTKPPVEEEEETEETYEEEEQEDPAVTNRRKRRRELANDPTNNWLDKAPPEVQEAFQQAREIENREKEAIVGKLIANVADFEKRQQAERLMKRPLAELRADLAMLPVDSKAEERTATANKGKARNNEYSRNDDVLAPPSINWKSEAGDDEQEPLQVANESNFQSVSSEEWISSAPPEVRAAVNNALRIEQRERTSIIEQLIANVDDEDKAKRLAQRFRSKSLEELRDLLDVAPSRKDSRPSYLGQPAFNRGAKPTNNSDDDDILRPPSFSFADDENSDARKRA